MPYRFITYLTKLNTLYVGTLLFIVTLFCYANTLGNGLFFDDQQFIYDNQAVKTFDVPALFGRSLISGGGKLSNYYRPLLFTGFALEYQVFADNGFIYHFNSALTHFFGGLFLYLLIKKLFKNNALALLTSLLFLIHPVQTEAVSYASGRGDPLSFMFVMLTLLLSLAKTKKYLLYALACFIAALLSKEAAIITPGLIFLVHVFKEKSFNKLTLKKSLLITLPFIAVAAIYFLLRISVFNFSNTLNFYNTTNAYSGSLFVRLNTFFQLFPMYVQLLIFPKDLFMERDSGISIYTAPTIQSVGTVIGLIIAFLLAYIKKGTLPVLLFGLVWIMITFIPTSGIIPINGIFYEHFLYYPSVGFFLISSSGILYLINKASPWIKEIISICLLLAILAFCIRTISRNTEWHDPIVFYNQTLSHVKSSRAYNNLAMAYADAGQNKEAINTYKKAIDLADAYPESHFNLANTYMAISDITTAEKEYKKALEIDPGFYPAYGTLYRLYKTSSNTEGLSWVSATLTKLGRQNPNFLKYLHQLQTQ